MHFDVFNGDADGIVALVQLRLAEPKDSVLITGVKRDISLLKQVNVSIASSVTVLDVSLEKNLPALNELLSAGVAVFYCDHHRTGPIPESSYLTTRINTDANTCTSLLINQHLRGAYVNWAIVAAFGDNMEKSARALAKQQGLSEAEQDALSALGVYINYNGYGRSMDDLHFPPADLFKLLVQYDDPLVMLAQDAGVFTQLEQAYQQDMHHALSAKKLADNAVCQVTLLADEAWARRISGVFGNELANNSPNKAHAVLTLNADQSYTVSVRAPLNNKQGADHICSQFTTGGGRAAAAGINRLPFEEVDDFIAILTEYYQKS